MNSDNSFIDAAKLSIDRSRAFEDPDYPRFHVTPPVGRMNDPNGLVVIDGVYHVFYQFGPFFPDHKEICWGHASSSDLVNWTTHDPAIPPSDWYDRNGVYSGGATIRGDEVWLHYTGNVKNDRGQRESYQCAVVTTDFEEFTKVEANPLISGPPEGYTAHIRDPYIVGVDDGYRMYLGAQRKGKTGCILVYSSTDLLEWALEGEVEVDDPRYAEFGYMWECPNILRLTDEETGEEFDVLLFSPQGIESQDDQFRNVFACGYVIGHLEGTHFEPAGEFTELDNGFEFYAPQVFTTGPNEPAQDPLLVGWAGNGGEDDQPSLAEHGWIHTLTVPRDLVLIGGRIYQRPRRITGEATQVAISGMDVKGGAEEIAELAGVRSFILDLSVEQAGEWGVVIGDPDGLHITVTFTRGVMIVDRSATRYPHGQTRRVSIPDLQDIDVTIVHDRSVTEIFVGEGHTAFTMRSYLDPENFEVLVSGQARILAANATVFNELAG